MCPLYCHAPNWAHLDAQLCTHHQASSPIRLDSKNWKLPQPCVRPYVTNVNVMYSYTRGPAIRFFIWLFDKAVDSLCSNDRGLVKHPLPITKRRRRGGREESNRNFVHGPSILTQFLFVSSLPITLAVYSIPSGSILICSFTFFHELNVHYNLKNYVYFCLFCS